MTPNTLREALPSLPKPWQRETAMCPPLFTAEQMRDYALLARLAPPAPGGHAVPFVRTGAFDKNGREILAGDRIRYLGKSDITKPEYWHPEYVVEWRAPRFRLKHVGGDLHNSSARFAFEHTQDPSWRAKLEVIAAAPAPDVEREAMCTCPTDDRCLGTCAWALRPDGPGFAYNRTPPAEAREPVVSSGGDYQYRHKSLPGIDGEWTWMPWQQFSDDMQIRRSAARPRDTPREPVGDAEEGQPEPGAVEPMPDTPAHRYLASINGCASQGWIDGFNACAMLPRDTPRDSEDAVLWIDSAQLADLTHEDGGTLVRVWTIPTSDCTPLLAAAPAPAVMLNGLTEAETDATASVMGLRPAVEREASAYEGLCPDCTELDCICHDTPPAEARTAVGREAPCKCGSRSFTDDECDVCGSPPPELPTPPAEAREPVGDAVLVPRVPTQAMIGAWNTTGPRFEDAYAAMIAAAPAPAVGREAEKPIGTITRRDSGNEVLEHEIVLDDAFEESLYRYDAGTVFNLYATPSLDAARAHMERARAELFTTPRAEAREPVTDAEAAATRLWQLMGDPIIEFDAEEQAAIQAGIDALRALAQPQATPREPVDAWTLDQIEEAWSIAVSSDEFDDFRIALKSFVPREAQPRDTPRDAGDAWRPIETAPKDRPVWVRGWDWGKPNTTRHQGWAYWNGVQWQWSQSSDPRHATYLTDWLPTAPATQSPTGEPT